MTNFLLLLMVLAAQEGPTAPESPPPVKGANGPAQPRFLYGMDRR